MIVVEKLGWWPTKYFHRKIPQIVQFGIIKAIKSSRKFTFKISESITFRGKHMHSKSLNNHWDYNQKQRVVALIEFHPFFYVIYRSLYDFVGSGRSTVCSIIINMILVFSRGEKNLVLCWPKKVVSYLVYAHSSFESLEVKGQRISHVYTVWTHFGRYHL